MWWAHQVGKEAYQLTDLQVWPGWSLLSCHSYQPVACRDASKRGWPQQPQQLLLLHRDASNTGWPQQPQQLLLLH